MSSDNSARKDEIAEALRTRVGSNVMCSPSCREMNAPLDAWCNNCLLQALTSYEEERTPSGEGWQQRAEKAEAEVDRYMRVAARLQAELAATRPKMEAMGQSLANALAHQRALADERDALKEELAALASPPAPSGWQQRIAETERRAFEAGFLASPGGNWDRVYRTGEPREWRFTGDADTHPAHDLMSDAWGAWKRLPASQALPESKRSGSDILLHHLDLWANHARGCSADDCPRCEADFNLVIKAHTVWSNSQNGQHAKDALPPSSSDVVELGHCEVCRAEHVAVRVQFTRGGHQWRACGDCLNEELTPLHQGERR